MEANKATHVYQVYIKATPEAIWDAITKPEWTQRYGYRSIAEYDLRPGGVYRGLLIIIVPAARLARRPVAPVLAYE